MLGTLYIVTNDINDKVYIGKTYASLDTRWKRHLSDAKRQDRRTSGKFHAALIEYGSKHFKIKEIAKFEEGILEQKEVEYISKYNSYYNGYNSTLGGDGTRSVDFSDSDIDYILTAYDSGESITKLATYMDVSSYTIKSILNQHNRNIQSFSDVEVVRYSTDFKYIRTYRNIREALVDIKNEGYSTDLRNLYRYIHEACNTGCIRYGSRWRLKASLSDAEIESINNTTDFGKVTTNTRVKRDSCGVTCVELELYFETFKEAANYLIDNGYTSATNIPSLAYKISQAKKNNKKCFNLTWM